MMFTTFNALGPIAVMDEEGWSAGWSSLGPGALREVAARKLRLEKAREVDNSLYRIFDEKVWTRAFEDNPFQNEGLNLYQASWLAKALTQMRTFETRMRSAGPISIESANNDLAQLRLYAQHLDQAADELDKGKSSINLLDPHISDAEAIALLSNKFFNYPVLAGEGGPSSSGGNMSFRFSNTGFELAQARNGWYCGVEPVSYSSIEPASVRYDPDFGGNRRGGLVYQAKPALRASFRGPAGLLLPLGTKPKEAETLAQAFKHLAKVANGDANAVPAANSVSEPDRATKELAARLRDLDNRLLALGNLTFRVGEFSARAPAPLAAAIAKRDTLWRDSELVSVIKGQLDSNPKFVEAGHFSTLEVVSIRICVPVTLEPTEPPRWRIVKISIHGNEAVCSVRQVSEAKNKKTGEFFTLSRFTEETWLDPTGEPKLIGLRLLSATKGGAPQVATSTALARRFFRLGDQYLKNNQLPQAERMLRRTVAMRPEWASAWNWLGVAVTRQQRVDEAEPLLEYATNNNPQYALAKANLADVKRIKGDYAESLNLAKQAVALDPKDAYCLTIFGNACFVNGDFAGAERQYREVITLDDFNGAAHADLAGALLRQNNRQEAQREANRAISLGWTSHWVYKELGIAKS